MVCSGDGSEDKDDGSEDNNTVVDIGSREGVKDGVSLRDGVSS